MLPFCRPSNLRAVQTFTLLAGVSVGGDYVVAALKDGDPELGLWIAETTIALQGDLGAAVRIDGIVVLHHNLREGTDTRVRVHSTASWGGAVDITVPLTVPAWNGRFAPHLYFNVKGAAAVVGDRTRRYFHFENLDANGDPIKIGEVLVVGQIEYLECGMGRGAEAPETYGRSLNPSRAGVATVHDYRTRNRIWQGEVRCDGTDQATFQALQGDCYGLRPFVSWPLSAVGEVTGEPIFGRFVASTFDRRYQTVADMGAAFAVQELSCGEAY